MGALVVSLNVWMRLALVAVPMASLFVLSSCGLMGMVFAADAVPARCRPFALDPATGLAAHHIVPEWYLLPFYAVMRSITFGIGSVGAKTLGLYVWVAAHAAPLVIGLFDWRKMGLNAWTCLGALLPVVLGLGIVGAMPADGRALLISQVLTGAYFLLLIGVFPCFARSRRPTKPPRDAFS